MFYEIDNKITHYVLDNVLGTRETMMYSVDKIHVLMWHLHSSGADRT